MWLILLNYQRLVKLVNTCNMTCLQSVSPDPGSSLFPICWVAVWKFLNKFFPQHPWTFCGILLCIIPNIPWHVIRFQNSNSLITPSPWNNNIIYRLWPKLYLLAYQPDLFVFSKGSWVFYRPGTTGLRVIQDPWHEGEYNKQIREGWRKWRANFRHGIVILSHTEEFRSK